MVLSPTLRRQSDPGCQLAGGGLLYQGNTIRQTLRLNAIERAKTRRVLVIATVIYGPIDKTALIIKVNSQSHFNP